MKTIGILIIVGVLLWLFVVTLPYIWWIWLILIGFLFLTLAKEAKDKKVENKEK